MSRRIRSRPAPPVELPPVAPPLVHQAAPTGRPDASPLELMLWHLSLVERPTLAMLDEAIDAVRATIGARRP